MLPLLRYKSTEYKYSTMHRTTLDSILNDDNEKDDSQHMTLHLTHQYKAPAMSDDAKAQALENLKRQLFPASFGGENKNTSEREMDDTSPTHDNLEMNDQFRKNLQKSLRDEDKAASLQKASISNSKSDTSADSLRKNKLFGMLMNKNIKPSTKVPAQNQVETIKVDRKPVFYTRVPIKKGLKPKQIEVTPISSSSTATTTTTTPINSTSTSASTSSDASILSDPTFETLKQYMLSTNTLTSTNEVETDIDIGIDIDADGESEILTRITMEEDAAESSPIEQQIPKTPLSYNDNDDDFYQVTEQDILTLYKCIQLQKKKNMEDNDNANSNTTTSTTSTASTTSVTSTSATQNASDGLSSTPMSTSSASTTVNIRFYLPWKVTTEYIAKTKAEMSSDDEDSDDDDGDDDHGNNGHEMRSTTTSSSSSITSSSQVNKDEKKEGSETGVTSFTSVLFESTFNVQESISDIILYFLQYFQFNIDTFHTNNTKIVFFTRAPEKKVIYDSFEHPDIYALKSTLQELHVTTSTSVHVQIESIDDSTTQVQRDDIGTVLKPEYYQMITRKY